MTSGNRWSSRHETPTHDVSFWVKNKVIFGASAENHLVFYPKRNVHYSTNGNLVTVASSFFAPATTMILVPGSANLAFT